MSRLFLNYDFAFLAMVLAPVEHTGEYGCSRCILHPIQGKPACEGGAWLSRAAGESVILAYWKLRDTMEDEAFFARVRARLLCLGLKRGYRKASAELPAFAEVVRENLNALRALEQESCPSIDRTADAFAKILCAAVPGMEDTAQSRAVEQLFYHLGRWIYLIDAVDDLPEDLKKGQYNPVSARFPQWSEEDRLYLRGSMDHSLGLMGAAFQLLTATPWTEVVENVIYSGLPGVEELVFSGRWRENQKRHRRNDL